MRLDQLEQVRGGVRPTYRSPVETDAGRYELLLSGPAATVKKAFAKAELEIDIDPKATPRSWEAEAKELLGKHSLPDGLELSDLEDGLKKKFPTPTAAKSVLGTLRRVEGDGTRFAFSISNFFVPTGFSFFFGLPLVCTCLGIVAPRTGDQDLLLHLGWPPVGPIRISARGGTAVDVVTFASPCTPFTQFIPIFQVFGWRSGTCANFFMRGADFLG